MKCPRRACVLRYLRERNNPHKMNSESWQVRELENKTMARRTIQLWKSEVTCIINWERRCVFFLVLRRNVIKNLTVIVKNLSVRSLRLLLSTMIVEFLQWSWDHGFLTYRAWGGPRGHTCSPREQTVGRSLRLLSWVLSPVKQKWWLCLPPGCNETYETQSIKWLVHTRHEVINEWLVSF